MDTSRSRVRWSAVVFLAAASSLWTACGAAPAGASASPGVGSSSSSGTSSSSGSTSSGSTSSSSGASSGGPTERCVGTSSKAAPQALDIYIMLDRSPSMADSAGGTTKWAAVTGALSSFVGQPQDGTSVGLQYFPAAMDWTSGADRTCSAAAYATPEVEIGPLARTATSIRTSMSRQQFQPNTPTSAALQGAVDHARAWAGQAANSGHAVVVLLATDGDPTSCDTDVGRIGAIAAIGVSASPSVRTFVIGVGDLKANLDAVAKAGGTGAAYIVDTSGNVGSQFLQALNDLRKTAVGCSYAIPAAPAGQQLDYAQVRVDYQAGGAGAARAFAQVASAAACATRSSAWHYDDDAAPKSIVLCPETCATVQADTAAAVQIVLGCSSSGEW